MTTRIFGATGVKAMACVLSLQFCMSMHAQDAHAAPASSAAASAASDGAKDKKNCRPAYPEVAKRAKAEGTTVVQLTVSATGAAAKVEVAKSAGATPEHKLLDEAAVDALRTCPFKPAVDAAGNAVDATIKVTYVWLLDPPVAAASGVRK